MTLLTCEGNAAQENKLLELLLTSNPSEPVHLDWHYDVTNIVIGRGQKITPEMKQRAIDKGVDIYQRQSGGGAVLASPNLLSVSTIIPATHPLARQDLIRCFYTFGKLWQKALITTHVMTELCETVNKGNPICAGYVLQVLLMESYSIQMAESF